MTQGRRQCHRQKQEAQAHGQADEKSLAPARTDRACAGRAARAVLAACKTNGFGGDVADSMQE
jgi:hypothetical protein